MNGVTIDQGVRGTKDGSDAVFTISELISAWKADPSQLYRYKIYVMPDASTKCTLEGISEIIESGTNQLMRLTSASGGTLTMSVDGLMYDYTTWADTVHLTVNHPGNARYFVGYGGRQEPDVDRTITNWELLGSGTLYRLPLLNFLTEDWAVVLSV